MNKKLLAIVLTGAMVLGSSVTAFASDPDSTTPKASGGTTLADDSTPVEGTGTEEGLVNTRLYRVTLPVIPATSLNYTIDPQGLIKETDAAAYGENVTVGEGNLFFVNHGTLNETTEGTKTGLSGTSDEFSLVNKSTFPITVTVTTKVSAGTSGSHVLVPGISANATPTGTDVALAYSDNSGKTGQDALLLTTSDQTPSAVLGDAKAAYKYGYASSAYSYTFDSEGTYDFATLKFKYTGAVTVDDTKTGSKVSDWTIKTPAAAGTDEVRYASISAPKISVKYKLDEYTGSSDPDIAGPEESAPVAPTAGTASVLPYQGANYLGLKGASGASFTQNATSVKVNNIDVTNKATLISGYVAVSADDLRAAGVTVAGGTPLNAVYVVGGVTYNASTTP